MAKNSSKLAGKIFPDAFNRADEIKQLPLAQLDQSIKELVKLGECVEILSGFAFKSDLFNTEKNGMPLIRIRDVVPAKTETYYSGDYLDDYLINNDDLLIGMDGDFNREKWQGGKALLNQRVCKISAVPSILDQDYLYHFLPKALLKIHSETPAVTVKHLSVKTIKEIEIPLPPLAEQKRIAAILDKADAIRRKRQQAIELADEFLRSVFLDMFGDPVTNPKGWENKLLGDVVTIRRGASPRPINDFLGGTVPWIKIGDATKGDDLFINSTAEAVTEDGAKKSVFLKEGSLIFANCGVSLGFARILGVSGCIHDGWLSIENFENAFNKIFLLKWINQLTSYFRSIAPDGTQPNLNTTIMKSQNIIIPPIGLQREFAKRVEKVEALKAKLKASQLQAEEQFKALSQRAFAGEL